MGASRRTGLTPELMAALAAMRDAPGGGAEFERPRWRAGSVTFAHSEGWRLIKLGLVEVVRANRDGMAMRIELNLRGQDALAESDALLALGGFRLAGGPRR